LRSFGVAEGDDEPRSCGIADASVGAQNVRQTLGIRALDSFGRNGLAQGVELPACPAADFFRRMLLGLDECCDASIAHLG
jgi:hypothetical protein